MTSPVTRNHSDDSKIHADANAIGDVSETQFRTQSRSAAQAVQFSDGPAVTSNAPTRPKNHPKIQAPEISTLDLIALLKELQRTTSISDVKTALTHANQINTELDMQKAKDIENQATIRAQQTEINKTTASKKVMNWIIAIASFILAVVAVVLAVVFGAFATVFTGGVAAPAMVVAVITVVGVVIGIISTTLSVINLVLQEVPKVRNVFGEEVSPEISLTALINFVEEKMVENGTIKIIGVNATSDTPGAITKKQFDKNKEDRTFAINVTFACVMLVVCIVGIGAAIVSGIRAAATVAEKTVEVVTEATTQVASRSQLIAQIASAAASALIAGGSGFNSYLSISLGIQRNSLGDSMITEKTFESAIQALQQQFDANQQHFRNAMDFSESLRTRISSLVAEFIDTSIVIAKNTKV
jgi:hypothetical protein